MTFRTLMSSTLPKTMRMPSEFDALFDWMDRNRCVGTSVRGDKFGVLDSASVREKGGSAAYFHQPFSDHHWTGCDDEIEMARLSTFMRTGWDGSSAAFWLDDAGNQHIVHMGSGSGSLMVGIWTKSPIDLLRLLAIGYVDLCWPQEYDFTPVEIRARDEYAPSTKAPMKYRNWLHSTFGVTIPAKAAELVGPMSTMGEESDDPFCKWLASLDARQAYGDRFVMNFDATVLYPGKQKPPEFRGTDLPYLAVVWAGTPKTDGRYELLTAKEPICAGALLPINLRQSQEFENWGQSRLENIVTGATPEAPRPAYKNKDDTWFVSCNSITCTNIFLNATWTAELIVLENDVCASSMMNGNLRQIVDPWVKKAIQ